MTKCPTSITDDQYKSIKLILDSKERKRKFSLRCIFEAILYIAKTGCCLMIFQSGNLYTTIFPYGKIPEFMMKF